MPSTKKETGNAKLDQPFDKVIEAVQDTMDLKELDALRILEETEGENRITVLQAIDDQYDLIAAPADSPEEEKKQVVVDQTLGVGGVVAPPPPPSTPRPRQPAPQAGPVAHLFQVVRPIYQREFDWLARDINVGETLYAYIGEDAGYCSEESKRINVTFDEDGYGEFFQVPRPFLEDYVPGQTGSIKKAGYDYEYVKSLQSIAANSLAAFRAFMKKDSHALDREMRLLGTALGRHGKHDENYVQQ